MEEKSNKKIKIKIIVLFTIMLFSGFGLYHVYINKDNNVRYYTKEEVKMLLEEISFANIAEKRYTYEEQFLSYQFETIYLKIDDSFKNGSISENVNREKDINGEGYGDYKKMGPEYTAKLLGFTVDAINKMDKSFFDDSYNNIGEFNIIDGNEFKRVYKELYGETDMFNDSFVVNEASYSIYNHKIYHPTYMYDINMNKVITRRKIFSIPGSHKNRFIEIIDEEENYREYKLEFVEAVFNMNRNGGYVLNNIDVELENRNNEDEMRKIIKENIDKLKKYTVIFKKTRKGYTYKSVS